MACFCAASLASSFGCDDSLLAQEPRALLSDACCMLLCFHMWEIQCWAPQVQSCGFSCTPSAAHYVSGDACQQHHMVGGGSDTDQSPSPACPVLASTNADALNFLPASIHGIIAVLFCTRMHSIQRCKKTKLVWQPANTCYNLKQSKPV